jgi:hypothetical protein
MVAECTFHDGVQGHQGDMLRDLQRGVLLNELLPFVLWWEGGIDLIFARGSVLYNWALSVSSDSSFRFSLHRSGTFSKLIV